MPYFFSKTLTCPFAEALPRAQAALKAEGFGGPLELRAFRRA
jgi:hypothetical protein